MTLSRVGEAYVTAQAFGLGAVKWAQEFPIVFVFERKPGSHLTIVFGVSNGQVQFDGGSMRVSIIAAARHRTFKLLARTPMTTQVGQSPDTQPNTRKLDMS